MNTFWIFEGALESPQLVYMMRFISFTWREVSALLVKEQFVAVILAGGWISYSQIELNVTLDIERLQTRNIRCRLLSKVVQASCSSMPIQHLQLLSHLLLTATFCFFDNAGILGATTSWRLKSQFIGLERDFAHLFYLNFNYDKLSK